MNVDVAKRISSSSFQCLLYIGKTPNLSFCPQPAGNTMEGDGTAVGSWTPACGVCPLGLSQPYLISLKSCFHFPQCFKLCILILPAPTILGANPSYLLRGPETLPLGSNMLYCNLQTCLHLSEPTPVFCAASPPETPCLFSKNVVPLPFASR